VREQFELESELHPVKKFDNFSQSVNWMLEYNNNVNANSIVRDEKETINL